MLLALEDRVFIILLTPVALGGLK